MARSTTKSIIRSSPEIKEALQKRFHELGLKYTSIINDAQERGQLKISKPGLSRYINGIDSGQLTEEQIIWLCRRYDIPLILGVGLPEVSNGNSVILGTSIKFNLPKFNENRALKILEMLK